MHGNRAYTSGSQAGTGGSRAAAGTKPAPSLHQREPSRHLRSLGRPAAPPTAARDTNSIQIQTAYSVFQRAGTGVDRAGIEPAPAVTELAFMAEQIQTTYSVCIPKCRHRLGQKFTEPASSRHDRRERSRHRAGTGSDRACTGPSLIRQGPSRPRAGTSRNRTEARGKPASSQHRR